MSATDLADVIRYVGLALQLAGIATVFVGLGRTRRHFGKPTVLGRLRAIVSAVWKPKPVFRDVRVAMSGGASFRCSIHAKMDPAAPVEIRLTALETSIEALTGVFKLVDEEEQRRQEALKKEAASRREELQQLRDFVELAHTGGLRLSAVGAGLLVFGVILATVPAEIACLFGFS